MKIPKKIHLTCKNKNNIDNDIWKKCLEKYKLVYPDYEIIIYDNEDIYNIVEKHHPEYLDKIKQIEIGAILADIFRYLILYLEGGIYSDFDCEPIKKIDELLEQNFQYYHGNKNRDNSYWIYKNSKEIINKEWDFTHNICDNCEVIYDKNNPIHMKCLGHNIDTSNISTILGYEFHSDFIDSKVINDDKWCYKKVGLCQWFMVTEPRQDIFIKTFNNIMSNIDSVLKISKQNRENYHYMVINTTGPLAFTKIVLNNLTDKIKILPCDFFCSGSWDNSVPLTRNSYVKHHFTGTWL
jgi:hypothetical protein